jgi:hypothetical protein
MRGRKDNAVYLAVPVTSELDCSAQQQKTKPVKRQNRERTNEVVAERSLVQLDYAGVAADRISAAPGEVRNIQGRRRRVKIQKLREGNIRCRGGV